MSIAGYSEEKLEKGKENSGEGFIASLSNEKAFHLKRSNQKAKITLYNDFYIIFGNAEMRIKEGASVVESNLGSTFRYFDT